MERHACAAMVRDGPERDRAPALLTMRSLGMVKQAAMTDADLEFVIATAELLPVVFRLRHDVFVVEQGVPSELERDPDDDVALHLAACLGGEVIGTLRMVGDGNSVRIGRVAVRAAARRRGIGGRLMAQAEAMAAARGYGAMTLHAQLAVVDFYLRHGYRRDGEVFQEAGIDHVGMRKQLA
jgi:predicted GNAT family N-acyltransferase